MSDLNLAILSRGAGRLGDLLKPVEPERLAAPLVKIRDAMSNQAISGDLPLKQLFVRDGPRC
jgi:hypothetical protein